MELSRLRARNLRRFVDVEFEPSPGLNLIIGPNGSGKTSLLEAAHLMAYGRSFRGRVRDGLIRAGQADLEVFIQWHELGVSDASALIDRRAGLRHSGRKWEGRLDAAPVAQLGELCAAFAMVTFEPGSHELITGASEVRRRYLDWGLFHVEPEFLRGWRRYGRALRQRNALLKAGAAARQLDAWDHELAESGEVLSERRDGYLGALSALFCRLAAELAPQVAPVSLDYVPGWQRSELSLADALIVARERDMAAGFTSVGPHRADWKLRFDVFPGRDALSRGQTKLLALAALLSQAEQYAQLRLEWPVIGLDDLASELDRAHQERVVELLLRHGGQVLVTGTEAPAGLPAAPVATFHVEHGELTRT